mmetsp:Transcript_11237/g.18826  ORF Transcript_11237/g.18826 Transcript_11237/m.18826 type:complete len:276 (+) Transcript_11237:176-1003(+)
MEGWLVGVLLVLLGCLCSAVGLVLMKHSTNVETHLPFFKRPFWFAGLVFLMFNALVIDVVALSLAPLVIVAPFSGVTIVFTSWLASSGLLFVKETLDIWDTSSTIIALIGVTIASLFGPHASAAPSASDIYGYFGKLDFRCFFGAAVIGLGLMWLPFVAGVAELRSSNLYRTVLFSYTSALFGSSSLLLLKVVGSGIRAWMESDTNVVHPIYLSCVVVLVMCAVVQLGFLHATLANSPVSYGVPTYQTLLTVLTIVSGGLWGLPLAVWRCSALVT